MKKQDIVTIFETLKKFNPTPETELKYKDPYTLLVAVVLSAQATDVGVNKATGPLFEVADTPAKMVALGEDKIRDYVKTIGLFKTKAKNVYLLSKQLIEKHEGQVPNSREDLEALPGVGRKTANVILNIVFGVKVIAVDTHIFRVSNRIGLVHENTREKTEHALMKVVPEEYMDDAHHWLILHGRYTCKARKPLCGNCPIEKWCQFKEKNL